MSNEGPIIVLLILLLMVLWLVDDENYIAVPEDISFAISVCKEGEWKSVDRLEVMCKDGATYKLKLGE